MRRWTLLFLLLFVLKATAGLGATADPRHLDATAVGGRVDLSHDWLFASTDDPGYAAAGFDDRGWKVVSTGGDRGSSGSNVNSPFCWYRLHARLRPGASKLAVVVGSVAGAYQVYANGTRIGSLGKMDAHSMQQQAGVVAYPIPDQALAGSRGELVLALRFSNQARRYQLRTLETPMTQGSVFLESQEATSRDASYDATHLEEVSFVLGGLNLLIGLVAVSLYLALRSRQEYLAIGIACLAAAADAAIVTWEFLGIFTVGSIALANCFEALQPLAIIEFVRLILGAPRTRWWLAMEGVAICAPLINPLASLGWSPVSVIFGAYFLSLLVMDVVLPILLVAAWWRGNIDARVLLPAFLLGIFSDYYSFIRQAMYYLHRPLNEPWALYVGSYRLSVSDLGSFAFSITILLFLVVRTIRIARERAEAAAEIEAAQTVQQVLLARASEPTPGFAVESVYHPHSEVGGDFFLVSPGAHGSLTAIIGDVSGKGLLAAMRVSMILGVLRREDSREPATILKRLNEALLAQSEMGFTTACCVHLEHDGAYAIANAGHISAYIGGVEVVSPPGLPLGLASHQEYEVITGKLGEGEKLVLMSDGVVEARSKQGELYGFERVAGLTLRGAEEIARAAREFGQEDDITVLTIACCV